MVIIRDGFINIASGIENARQEHEEYRLEVLSLFRSHARKIDEIDYSNESLPDHYFNTTDGVEKTKVISFLKWATEKQNARDLAFTYLCEQLNPFISYDVSSSRKIEILTLVQQTLIDRGFPPRIFHHLSKNGQAKSIFSHSEIKTSELNQNYRSKKSMPVLIQIMDDYKALLTGEWANRFMGKILNDNREKRSFYASKEEPSTLSVFLRTGFMDSFHRPQSSFYSLESKDPLEAYLACVYQIGHDLFSNPLSTLQKEKKEYSEILYFAPPFFTLAPHQIKIIDAFGKTSFGKKCLQFGGPGMLDEEMPTLFTLGKAVCNKKWYKYTDAASYQNDYCFISLMYLENEYQRNPIVDPRYTALCHLFALPERMPLKDKLIRVFGSDDKETLNKLSHLIDFYREGKNRAWLSQVFMAHELKAYLPHHSATEILGLSSVLLNQQEYNADDKVLRLFQANPELALLILQEPSKKGPLAFKNYCITDENVRVWLSEKNFKACEKSILNMRFGKKPLENRLVFQKDIERIIRDASKIRAFQWVYNLEVQLKEAMGISENPAAEPTQVVASTPQRRGRGCVVKC